jgi:CheY-like chemotaxis protein
VEVVTNVGDELRVRRMVDGFHPDDVRRDRLGVLLRIFEKVKLRHRGPHDQDLLGSLERLDHLGKEDWLIVGVIVSLRVLVRGVTMNMMLRRLEGRLGGGLVIDVKHACFVMVNPHSHLVHEPLLGQTFFDRAGILLTPASTCPRRCIVSGRTAGASETGGESVEFRTSHSDSRLLLRNRGLRFFARCGTLVNKLTHATGDHGRRVLVVDDNVALAENIVELLELVGYVVEIAASAEEALPKVLTGQVAFIITDYLLPGLNGAELIKSVRSQGHQVRAVIMSAYSDEGTIRAATEAGIADFIPKPVDFARLTRLLAVPGSFL